MTYLKDNYEIVAMKDITRINGTKIKPKITISFDDAYANLIEHALQVLFDYKIPAIIYAPTYYLGKQNNWDEGYMEPLMPIMTAKDLKMMSVMGFDIGSHTHTHIRLKGQNLFSLRREIVDSKKILEDIVQEPIESFAYPHGGRGDIDDNAVEIVKEAGYSSAVTTYFGRYNYAYNRYQLRRIIIWPSDDLNVFKLKVKGYYDWLIPKEIMINCIKTHIER